MNKFIILSLILVGCTAPVTDPPAHACSLPLDGTPANCPDTLDDIKLPRKQVRGEVDIYNIDHWGTLHGVYVDNLRRSRIEQTATKPSDSIDSALADFWSQETPTELEE
tara:strand:+ start:195 stop:521 length:327 start_codon:yes stop_codon:yes gene_type:complete